MTIRHHPSDELLTAFAAGTLDRGQHIGVATHLAGCPRCRGWQRTMEQVGGTVLASLPPSTMSGDALARVEARLDAPARAARMTAPPAPSAVDDVPRLPAFVRRYPWGRWTWVAPRVHLRRMLLPDDDGARVFLLRSGAGTNLLQHTHTGMEMTCVLVGGFSHDGGHYGPGDFDLGDPTVDHQPLVDPGEDCVCLVAMEGQLRLNGLIGRVMQPFIRM
ncbi:MAG: ChrR family anti-sigma-E factor [Xanthobacteraceae bacterium]|jgi:putative transcriptional regulator